MHIEDYIVFSASPISTTHLPSRVTIKETLAGTLLHPPLSKPSHASDALVTASEAPHFTNPNTIKRKRNTMLYHELLRLQDTHANATLVNHHLHMLLLETMIQENNIQKMLCTDTLYDLCVKKKRMMELKIK